MTYTERYNAIIHYFQRHPVDKKKIYCETHHIVPASCGGSNEKENLVNLPAAWHYRVHCYLPFVMREQNNEVGYHKMLHAWKRCLNASNSKLPLFHINDKAREYQVLREEFAKSIGSLLSVVQKGEKNSNYNHHWWKDPNDKTKMLSIKEGDPVPEGWIKGKWITEKERCGNATRGKIEITNGKNTRFVLSLDEIPDGWRRGIIERSKEARQKMAIAAKERNQFKREKMMPIMQEKLRPLFDCFYAEGFKAVQEKFGYKYTCVNLCQQFRKYFPEEYAAKKKNHNRFK